MRRGERGFSLIEMLTVVGVLAAVLLAVGQLVDRLQRQYDTQRRQIEVVDNARAALDTLMRLTRQAGNNPRGLVGLQSVLPDVDGNGLPDSIAFQSDWNPADGAVSGPYENIVFFVAGGRLMKREAGDPPEGEEFASGIESIAYSYFDTEMNPLAAVPPSGQIAYVAIALVVQPAGAPPLTISSGAAVRRRE
jgi:prepilin-type N-terminal cleavage/methylation domain-containing protein